MRSLSSSEARGGRLAPPLVWNSSYSTMDTACERLRTGYPSCDGMWTRASHIASCSCVRPMSSGPKTRATLPS